MYSDADVLLYILKKSCFSTLQIKYFSVKYDSFLHRKPNLKTITELELKMCLNFGELSFIKNKKKWLCDLWCKSTLSLQTQV